MTASTDGATLRAAAPARRRKTLIVHIGDHKTGSTSIQDAFFPDIKDLARPRPISEQEANADLLAGIDPASLPSDALRDLIASLQRGNKE